MLALINDFAKDHANPNEFTICLENVPARESKTSILASLKQEGFAGTFDFLYLPLCFQTRANKGYGFINFVDWQAAPRFMSACDRKNSDRRFKWSASMSTTQGLQWLMTTKWAKGRNTRIRDPAAFPYIRAIEDLDHMGFYQAIAHVQRGSEKSGRVPAASGWSGDPHCRRVPADATTSGHGLARSEAECFGEASLPRSRANYYTSEPDSTTSASSSSWNTAAIYGCAPSAPAAASSCGSEWQGEVAARDAAVAERDSHIQSWQDAVAERDSQLQAYQQRGQEREQELEQLRQRSSEAPPCIFVHGEEFVVLERFVV